MEQADTTAGNYSLGGADAWGVEEGESLPTNFLRIEEFSEIAGKNKTFLCGRRGSGKSAIARMLAREKAWKYKQSIPGEQQEYGEYMRIVGQLAHERQYGMDIDIKQAVKRLWAWVLPVVAMQTVIQAEVPGSESDSEHMRVMEGYLKSLPKPLHSRSTIGHLLRHTFDTALKQAASGSFDRYLSDLVNSEEFFGAVGALAATTKRSPALIVLDTLESYRIFQNVMIEGLSGVLQAVIAFLADERMHHVSVKLFIPAEILDELASEFPGKIHPATVFLRWRAGDLISMISRRYLSVMKRTKALPTEELGHLERAVDEAYGGRDGRGLRERFWYERGFLPKNIKNRAGRKEDCFAYIFRHTMWRPRDFVTAVMQSIVNESVARNEFPRISGESVVRGVHNRAAMQQILAEALSPYEGKFPGTLIRRADTVFHERSAVMNGHQLRVFAKEFYTLKPPKNVDSDRFLEMLLQCGVIGKLEEDVTTLQGPYRMASFEHLMQGHLALADRLEYCVHPVMAHLFGMTPPPNYSIYPVPSQEDRWLEEAARPA